MRVELPLTQMSINEKLQTIEMIWDDINHTHENFTPPSWHQEILEHRDKNIASGKDNLMDWESAKYNLQNIKCK